MSVSIATMGMFNSCCGGGVLAGGGGAPPYRQEEVKPKPLILVKKIETEDVIPDKIKVTLVDE